MARVIESLHIRDFRCCKDVKFNLTDLHAFVGPNDSGKSTLLEAISSVSRPLDSGVIPKNWALELAGGVVVRQQTVQVNAPHYVTPRNSAARALLGTHLGQHGIELPLLLRPHNRAAEIVRLDPDHLREPGSLIAGEIEHAWFASPRGRGLPAIYDIILSQKRAAFNELEAACRALYPTVAELLLENVGAQKQLATRLIDGTHVGTENMSEGMLFFLAFAAMQHIRPAPILLVEEPETGLHPSRIADVVGVLRNISRERQVVITTHSPLVINELRASEVSVVTRDATAGTKVTPIADTPKFAERAKAYQLGELWLAYCNGEDEAPLLNGTPYEARDAK